MANLATMIGIYFFLTTIFVGSNFYFKVNDKSSMTQVSQMIYITSVLLFSYFSNLAITKDSCGTNQETLAMVVTLFPWILFLGMIIILLQAFPGWKSPFSNTIGYAIAKGLGVSSVLYKLVQKKTNRPKDLVDKVYNRPALLANMFTPNNIDQQAPSMFNIGKSDPIYKKFKQIILVKDAVAEFCWYLITGLLIISYQSSYLANYGCNVKVDDGSPDMQEQNFCPAYQEEQEVYTKN